MLTLLTVYAKRLEKEKLTSDEALVLISMFTDIAMDSPRCYNIVLKIISELLQIIPTTEDRTTIVKNVYTKFERLPNIGELQIWLQRITYKLVNSIKYTEPICRIVANESEVELWNLDWVSDEYKKDFPLMSICTDWIRDSYTPVINIDEISLFEY